MSPPPPCRVLVIGHAGQVATELRAAPLPPGWVLSAVGRPAAELTDRHRLGELVAASGAGIVVNAAAYTAVDRAESEPALAFAVNADGPLALARACAAAKVPLIHLSTDYVFDGRLQGRGYREDDPVNPIGVYGASKEAGERAVREAAEAHVILRTAWVYSPHGQNFVRTMLRLGAERPELGVVADQRGCPTAAADIAATILAVAARPAAGTGPFGTFHFAGTGETTWHGFAGAIFAGAASRGRTVPRLRAITTADYPTPARRPANSVLDSGRLRAACGIAAPPWEASLGRCLDTLLGPVPAGAAPPHAPA